jgi:hypothetical protein
VATLAEAVDRVRYELYKAEYFSDEDFDFPIPQPGTREHAQFLDWYAELQEKRTPDVTREFRSALNRALEVFGRAVPKHQPSLFTAPLVDYIPNIGGVLEGMIEAFYRADGRLFQKLKKRINHNAERLANASPRKLAREMEPGDLVHAYLGGTVLEQLLRVHIPLPFEQQTRYEGQWILARPGAGKTQAMACLINADLKQVIDGKASIIVLDSQGNTPGKDGKPPTLLWNLSHLKLFAPGQPLHGKLTYIKLDDIRPPRFNIFDLGLPGSPEQRFSSTRRLMQFVFSSEVGAEFTGGIDRLFSACLRVMLTIPGATLADMRRLLHADGAKHFAEEIAALTDPDDRNLFASELKRSSMGPTHTALLSRLEGIKSYPLFERLVSHPQSEFNLFDEIEQGRVIIIDTDAGLLEDGTAVVGRFFIALLGAVSRRRTRVDESRKTPCFVYIDELADYCKKGTSTNHLDEILATCRKQNIAVCMANQRMSQLSGDPGLLDGLRQCAIKFANPLGEDAYKIATRDMGETPAKSLTNKPAGSFGVHVSGMPRAVSVKIPFPTLSAQPYMSRDEYKEMWDGMRDRYEPAPPGDDDAPPSVAAPDPDPPPDPPDDPDPPPYRENKPEGWGG